MKLFFKSERVLLVTRVLEHPQNPSFSAPATYNRTEAITDSSFRAWTFGSQFEQRQRHLLCQCCHLPLDDCVWLAVLGKGCAVG